MFGEQGFDMNALLAQAQAMQSQLQRAQEELAAKQVRGSAGGDLVQVTVNGSGGGADAEVSTGLGGGGGVQVCAGNRSTTATDVSGSGRAAGAGSIGLLATGVGASAGRSGVSCQNSQPQPSRVSSNTTRKYSGSFIRPPPTH